MKRLEYVIGGVAVRLFIAVMPPKSIVARLIQCSELVPLIDNRLSGAKWVRPQAAHLTLSFLGEVEGRRVSLVKDACRQVAADHVASAVGLGELGAFPQIGRARTLVVELDRACSTLKSIAEDLSSHLRRLGFVCDPKPFRPHLTLARLREPVDLRGQWNILAQRCHAVLHTCDDSATNDTSCQHVLDGVIPVAGRGAVSSASLVKHTGARVTSEGQGMWTVGEFHLYRSELFPSGPRYSILSSYTLSP